jgi:hypothetical protein
MPPVHQLARLLLLATASVLLAACSSTSGSGGGGGDPASGEPVRMRLVHYLQGIRFELVSEAHTPRLEQYSTVADSAWLKASRKVASNKWMSGLRDYLEDQGFDKDAKPGASPDAARGLRWSLEVEDASGVRHVSYLGTEELSVQRRMNTYQKAFIDTFNSTQAFQAVEIDDQASQELFRNPVPAARRR